MAEKSRLLDAERRDSAKEKADKGKQIKDLMDELEKAMRFNTELKEDLNKEHAENIDLVCRVKAVEQDLKEATDAANTMRQQLEAELCDVRGAMEREIQEERERAREANDNFSIAINDVKEGAHQVLAGIKSELRAANEKLIAASEREAAMEAQIGALAAEHHSRLDAEAKVESLNRELSAVMAKAGAGEDRLYRSLAEKTEEIAKVQPTVHHSANIHTH
jgi:DNA repair exonuclease SbcCD ATPase subunit